MKLNIAVVLLTLGLVAASSAGQGRSTIDEIHMRATLQDVIPLTDFSGKVIPVDFDRRFALTVRVRVGRSRRYQFYCGGRRRICHSQSITALW